MGTFDGAGVASGAGAGTAVETAAGAGAICRDDSDGPAGQSVSALRIVLDRLIVEFHRLYYGTTYLD